MRCELSKDKLIGYFYADLDSSEKADFEAHLAKCKACQKELEQLTKTTKILRAWADEEPNLNLAFVQERTSLWKTLLPSRLRGLRWRRLSLGLTVSFAAILAVLALLNLEAGYQQGNFTLKLSLLPRPSAESKASPDPLDTPVTQREFSVWQQQSLQLIQEMIQAAELRQRRELQRVMAQFARDLDLQRRQDLQLVGKGLEVFQSSNEDRFYRTNEILRQLIRATQYQTSEPYNIEKK